MSYTKNSDTVLDAMFTNASKFVRSGSNKSSRDLRTEINNVSHPEAIFHINNVEFTVLNIDDALQIKVGCNISRSIVKNYNLSDESIANALIRSLFISQYTSSIANQFSPDEIVKWFKLNKVKVQDKEHPNLFYIFTFDVNRIESVGNNTPKVLVSKTGRIQMKKVSDAEVRLKNLKFVYIQGDAQVLSIGYIASNQSIEYGVAVCHENDVFNKATAKEIIRSRILADESFVLNGAKMHDIYNNIVRSNVYVGVSESTTSFPFPREVVAAIQERLLQAQKDIFEIDAAFQNVDFRNVGYKLIRAMIMTHILRSDHDKSKLMSNIINQSISNYDDIG